MCQNCLNGSGTSRRERPMIQERVETGQEPTRLFRAKAWMLVVLALVLGIAAGGGVTFWRMSIQHKRASDSLVAAMRVAMQVRAAQGNVNTSIKDINYELLVLGLSSEDIGQRPDTLRPFGIITKDMRSEPYVIAKRPESGKVANYPD